MGAPLARLCACGCGAEIPYGRRRYLNIQHRLHAASQREKRKTPRRSSVQVWAERRALRLKDSCRGENFHIYTLGASKCTRCHRPRSAP